jgi:hypothetical protein
MAARTILPIVGILVACGARSDIDNFGEVGLGGDSSGVSDAGEATEATLGVACTADTPTVEPPAPGCQFVVAETCSNGKKYFVPCGCESGGGTCNCGTFVGDGGPDSYSYSGPFPDPNTATDVCINFEMGGCLLPTEDLANTLYKICGFPLPQ